MFRRCRRNHRLQQIGSKKNSDDLERIVGTMRILIIGGTGIISTGITRLLVERGDDVVLYNRGQRPSQVEGGYTTITGDRKDFVTI